MCKICLNDICSGGCCDISYDTLLSLSYGIKTKISEIGDNYAERLREGRSCSPSHFDFKAMSIGRTSLSAEADLIMQYKKLTQLRIAVEKELKNLYHGAKSCVSQFAICKIKDQALDILSFNCLNECRKDLKVTTDDVDEWNAANPYCISRESWEALLYQVCNDLQVEIEVVKQRCDLVYEIVQEYRSCAIDFVLDLTEQDCKIQYDLLVNTVDCNITFDIFQTLLDCGISYNLVRTALECGITFDISKKDRCPMIVTLEGGYSLCDSGEDQNEQLRNIIHTFSIK